MVRSKTPSQRFLAALLVAVPLGCGVGTAGTAGSTGGAGSSGDASSSGTTTTDTGAGTTSAGDPLAACGPVGVAWSRCQQNPLASSGHMHPDGRVELSIGDPNVFFDEEDGVWKAWWSTGVAPSFTAPESEIEMGIKYAESADGVVWDIQEELTISAKPGSGEWDQFKLETPSVVKVPTNPPERRYLLAYSGAQGTRSISVGGQAVPVAWYQIGIAFSADGKHFTRVPAGESAYAGKDTGYPSNEGLGLLGEDMLADTPGVADGLVADPELFVENGVIHLFASSMAVNDKTEPLNFGVSHATSTDGIHWVPQPANPQVVGGVGPSLVKIPDTNEYTLFYAQDTDADKASVPSVFNPYLGVWRRTSTDLSTWSDAGPARDFTWDGSQKTEVYGLIAVGDMAYRDGVFRYYYPGWSAEDVPEGFVCPLQDGTYPPAVIVLDLALRAAGP